jgi:hypothetical protein
VCLRDNAESQQVQAWCASALLDRGCGKPVTAAVIADVRYDAKQIAANMHVDEAARIYQDMINSIEVDDTVDLPRSEYRALPAYDDVEDDDESDSSKRWLEAVERRKAVRTTPSTPRVRREPPNSPRIRRDR